MFSFLDAQFPTEETKVKIQVSKWKMDGRGKFISVTYNEKREIIQIDSGRELPEEERDIMEGMDGVCFVCPVPFKKGDIVYAPFQSRIGFPYADKEPFVLERVWYEGLEEERVNQICTARYCDCMDMTAYGYFQHPNGYIYYECMHDYLSLEHYTGPLEGKRQILKEMSSYFCEGTDLVRLLNHYHMALCEENMEIFRKELLM